MTFALTLLVFPVSPAPPCRLRELSGRDPVPSFLVLWCISYQFYHIFFSIMRVRGPVVFFRSRSPISNTHHLDFDFSEAKRLRWRLERVHGGR